MVPRKEELEERIIELEEELNNAATIITYPIKFINTTSDTVELSYLILNNSNSIHIGKITINPNASTSRSIEFLKTNKKSNVVETTMIVDANISLTRVLGIDSKVTMIINQNIQPISNYYIYRIEYDDSRSGEGQIRLGIPG